MEWISVNDRLPENHSDKIVRLHINGEITGGYCTKNHGWLPTGVTSDGYENVYLDGDVTHWMERPPQPGDL